MVTINVIDNWRIIMNEEELETIKALIKEYQAIEKELEIEGLSEKEQHKKMQIINDKLDAINDILTAILKRRDG